MEFIIVDLEKGFNSAAVPLCVFSLAVFFSLSSVANQSGEGGDHSVSAEAQVPAGPEGKSSHLCTCLKLPQGQAMLQVIMDLLVHCGGWTVGGG